MSISVKTQPAAEPVTVAQAKAHIRVTSAVDDAYITTLVSVARQRAETFLRRSIVTQTLELRMDSFPYEIDLLRPPVAAVTSIYYLDSDGISTLLDSAEYQTSLAGRSTAVVKPAVNSAWPTTQAGAYDAVTVEYVAGYGLPDDNPVLIPLPMQQAILLMVGDMYENRETIVIGTIPASLPMTAERLLAPYQIQLIG